MCLAPTLIPNPNFGRKDRMSYLVDVQSRYLKVPCGHCTECVQARQRNIVQRLQVEELTNHLFFCTLTYNPQSLPVVMCSNGYQIPYAARRDVALMIKRLKKFDAFGRPFKYFYVSELGSKRGRPHFHLIFVIEKRKGDRYPEIMQLETRGFANVLREWRRNYGSTRKPDYKPCCTYIRRMIRGELKSTYDFHYVNPSSSAQGAMDVAFYVTKYMMKPSERAVRLQRALKMNLDEDEYEDVWKLVRPCMCASPGLGMSDDVQIDYVRSCIDRSKSTDSEFPRYYNSVNGKTFPLSRYYIRKGLYNVDDATDFYFRSKKPADMMMVDERAADVKERKFNRLSKFQEVIDEHDTSELFNEILE